MLVMFPKFTSYLVSEIVLERLIDRTVGNVDLTEIQMIYQTFLEVPHYQHKTTTIFTTSCLYDDNVRRILPVAYQ